MTGYAQLGEGHVALALHSQMQLEGVEVNRVTFISTLKACSNLEFLTQYAYAKCKGLKEAQGTFLKIPNRDVVSWNAILTAFISHGCAERTFSLFDQMQQEGIKPDKFTLVSMLKACSTAGALEEGKLLYAHFVESGFKSDSFFNNSLVDLFGKCGDLEEARRVFDKLPERSVVAWSAMIAGHSLHGQESQAFDAFLQMQKERKRPDNYVYGSILRACSNVKALNKGYVQLGAGQEALVLFQQLLQQRGKPNSVTFMSALKACSNLGAIHEGRLMYGLIIESSVGLDKVTGNALVDMYSKCGSVQDAAAVFSSMLDKDIVTWNALIAGYALQGEYGLASLYFGSMQQEGIEPDDITFLSLLSSCNHLGLVDEGRHHFLSMERIYKITPTVEHLNCIVDLLGRTGHLKEAGDLLQLVPFEARSPGLLSLLSNSSSHGDQDVGRKCYNSAVEMDTSHASSYVHMSNLYHEFGMVEEANKLLESKNDTPHAWKKPGKAFIEVDNKVFDFTVGDQSHPQTVDIFEKLKRLKKRMEEKGHVQQLPFMIVVGTVSVLRETRCTTGASIADPPVVSVTLMKGIFMLNNDYTGLAA
ncbi:hypothetical protein GOP47_0014521 [Adiantum capillus-veneris]|uniref:Pentatricopeptide repeat-containing protein n=1 Tax=Adiantum capillus-veneris TaxID=13818 RepID=A0A9D4ZC85_ADICA|nr:hypothetical protein GOP47_0014521 [Adiantum capillus-veneris]